MPVDVDDLTVKRDACPVCGGAARDILFSAKHNSPEFIDFIRFEPYWSTAFHEAFEQTLGNALTYEIAECKDCGLHYLTEVLSELGMGLLYNEWLDQDMLKAHYAERKTNGQHDALLGLLRKRSPNGRKPRLLDFGAGYGNLVAISQARDFETYAFDIAADKNHSISRTGVSIVDDLTRYPAYFDLIWVNQVLEHLADPSEALKKLKASLADGGVMYLAVPDCVGLNGVFVRTGLSRELFEMLSPHQHINAFTGQTLRRLGKKHGLKPLGAFDYLRMYRPGMSLGELKLLAKGIIRNPSASTTLLFKNER